MNAEKRIESSRDARLVHERVGRDGEPGRERPRGPHAARSGDGAAPRARRQVEARDARDDQRHAERPEWREALVEDDQREDRHQRHAEPARDRVDAREVAVAVGAPEREEIEGVDHDRGDDERRRGGREAALGEPGEPDGEQHDRRHRHRRPEKRELVLRALGQRVPDRVNQRGGDDQGQGGASHTAMVAELPVVRGRKSLC